MPTRLVLNKLDFDFASLPAGLVIIVVVVVSSSGGSSRSGGRGALSLDASTLTDTIAIALVVVDAGRVCLLLVSDLTSHCK